MGWPFIFFEEKVLNKLLPSLSVIIRSSRAC